MPMQRPLTIAWSTSSDQHSDAFDTYRDSLSDMFDVVDVAHNGRKGFASLTTVTRFGASVIGRGQSVGQTFVRDAQRVRQSGLDHVSMVVNLSDGIGDFDGREARSGAGSVQLRDLARPSSVQTSAVDIVNLIVPRHMLPSWLLGQRFHGLTLTGETAGARLIASHLLMLATVSDDLSEDEGIAAIEATFVIAERFLGRDFVTSPLHTHAIHRTIRRRAMHVFDGLPPRSRTSVDDVARLIGVSRSSLYRAFEPMGGVLKYVRQRRLDRVYAALRSPNRQPGTIDGLAREHGFSSAGQLAAAFYKRFEIHAEDVTPAARTTRRGNGTRATGEMDHAAHDVFIDWLRIGEAA